jgi:surface antigen
MVKYIIKQITFWRANMKKSLLVIAVSTLFANSIYAFNTDFLSYSPVFYFTSQDTQIMEAATMNALNNGRDNAKVVWKNPKTGANGYVMPFNSTQKNGLSCRQLKVFNEANHVTGEATYQFCKINNEWKITH